MRHIRALGLAIGIAAAWLSTGVAAEPDRARLESAMRVRMFQTEMMVAGLGCNALDRYNAFVQRFEGQLVTNSRMVRAHFQRTRGAKAMVQLDVFLTRLANAASAMNIREGDGFCTTARAILGLIIDAPETDLTVVAGDRARSMAWHEEPSIKAAIAEALKGVK